MTNTTECGTGCGRPTKARLCDPCDRQLADALALLAAWTKPHPFAAATWDVEARRWVPDPGALARGQHGCRPTTVWDTASGRASLGGTKAYAAELDTIRARQTRRGDQAGPRPAPDSKVWAPNAKADRIDRRLTRAVQTWVALLAQGDVVAPHVIVSGNALARSCTWLLWHAHQIATHPLAADAWREFTAIARDLEKLVDRPEDRVYVGPCWHKPGGTDDGDGCPADLYAKPGADEVQCVLCGNVIGVKARRQWLEDHFESMELTAADASRALATIGLSVSGEVIRQWATRGHVVSPGRVTIDGRSRAVYRFGDLKARATWEAQHPGEARSERRKVNA